MAQAVTTQKVRHIGRPLKVLIPLIQTELQMGNNAAHDHYRRAGEMLIEARDLITYGSWGKWLTKNFALSRQTASVYMQWARSYQDNLSADSRQTVYRSLNDMRGSTERARENRQSKQQQDFRRVLREVARDEFVQERQARDAEVKLHRELAEELVDLGYRALATRLHPDRGGSKDAMARLNRVRDELRQFSQTRRFI